MVLNDLPLRMVKSIGTSLPEKWTTANPTWGDIFERSKLKARTSLLPRFSEKRHSRVECWVLKQHSKMSPQVGLTVLKNNPAVKSAYIPHTHIHRLTQSRWTPGPFPETKQSHWSLCAFTGMQLQSHWTPCAFTGMHPHANPQSRCPPQPFSPIPGWFSIYIWQETTRLSVCVCQVRGGVQSLMILRDFCCLVTYLCCVVSLCHPPFRFMCHKYPTNIHLNNVT